MVFLRSSSLATAAAAVFLASSSSVSAMPIDSYPDFQAAELSTYGNLTARAAVVSSSLKTCLSKTGVKLSYPSDSTYSSLDTLQNSALPSRKPGVFAVPNDENGVSAVVKCVAAEGGSQKISPRSGGHMYTGWELGSEDGWVVVDLKNLKNVNVNSGAKTADVGAGSRLGPMASTLADQGFALPHGTCPTVGVGGHGLGGGFGYASFGWGFLMDHIKSMRVVKPDGSIVTVSSSENTDLFYALRGAGSNNYGIVTQFTYNLETAPTDIVNYSKEFKSNADCVQAFLALQDLTATKGDGGFPREFGGEMLLTGETSGQGSACSFAGQYIGSKDNFKKVMKKFNDKVAAKGVTAINVKADEYNSWADSLKAIMGDLNTMTVTPENYYAKSLVTPADVRYDTNSAGAIMQALNDAGSHGPSISFLFLGPNSYSSTISKDSSAFIHRDAMFISQYYAYDFPKNNDGGAQDAAYAAFDNMVNAAKKVNPNANWHGYVNYIDAKQLAGNWGQFYYGDAVSKLKSIKEKYDPKHIFDYPMAIWRA
ncbi:unnamed protein product [Sympodiomycopsis kandeliae]